MKKILLKQKVALLLTVISLVSLLIVGLTVFIYVNKTLVSNKREAILSSSSEQMHESTLVFEKNKLFSYMLATQSNVVDYLQTPNEEKKNLLMDSLSMYTLKDRKYLAIYILDPQGLGLASTDIRFVGQDYSFRNYFKKAILGQASVDVAIGKTSNQFGYYFSNPVTAPDGQIIGVLVVKVDESDIYGPIDLSEIAKTNTIMLVDEFGIVLSSNDTSRRLKSLGQLTADENKQIKDSDRFLGRDIVPLQYDVMQQRLRDYISPAIVDVVDPVDQDTELISIVKLNNNLPFFLLTEIRLGTVNQQVNFTVLTIVLIILIILIITSFFMYYFMINFLKPIEKIKKFFNSISNGNFSQELTIDTGDEFSDLADRVKKMARDLGDLYQNLDQKVKDQTLQIADKVKESDDQNKAILNILEDVESEKNKVELLAQDLEKFKLAVDNASDQVVITDGEGLVIYGNKAVERITGYLPEEALGKKAGTLWKAPMPVSYYERMWQTIKEKKEVFVDEIENRRKNGERYMAKISISPVLDDDKNVIYFVAIEHDITKEKEIDKAKTEFVSLASHQLRTPLSAINWYTEMLLAGDAGAINDEQKKYLEEVAIGNKRMVDLVDDLLNVSRLDMGTFQIDDKPINLSELMQSAIKDNQPMILTKKLIIEEKEEGNLNQFPADEKLLRMVFQNLLSNAVKYTSPAGQIKIYLAQMTKGQNFGGRDLAEDSLVFSIGDSGMGIPEHQQDKIFTKLFRADNAKESETEGTGLGLYVIKSIVDKAGGLIWFKSEVNQGTTFYLTFPAQGMKMKEVEAA